MDRQTDRQTDGRTDGQTDRVITIGFPRLRWRGPNKLRSQTSILYLILHASIILSEGVDL